MLPLFDLHCDTFSELYKTKQKFEKNSLHISLEKARCFSPYVQICAIWSDYRYSDDTVFSQCLNNISFLREQGITTCTKLNNNRKNSFILSVEDARLLNNDLTRLDTLYHLGMRALTLNWKDKSCIGGGWNTNDSLSAFGKNVVKRASELGIIVDLSHSSTQVFYDALDLCKDFHRVPIASHSNSYSVCNHKRNLTDNQFIELSKMGSLVGISLSPDHLGGTGICDIMKHIYHYLTLGGERNVCLGCDFDGIASLPDGFKSIADLKLLYASVKKEFGKQTAENIFYNNAYFYFTNNL